MFHAAQKDLITMKKQPFKGLKFKKFQREMTAIHRELQEVFFHICSHILSNDLPVLRDWVNTTEYYNAAFYQRYTKRFFYHESHRLDEFVCLAITASLPVPQFAQHSVP